MESSQFLSKDDVAKIGDFTSIAPGATLGGNVSIGNSSAISLLSGVIQGKKIGNNCLIAAGAIVVNDIPDNSIVKGVPGKITGTRNKEDKYLG